MVKHSFENLCPVCGTNDFSVEELEIECSDTDSVDDNVYRTLKCHCPECNIRWTFCKVYEYNESYYDWIEEEEE